MRLESYGRSPLTSHRLPSAFRASTSTFSSPDSSFRTATSKVFAKASSPSVVADYGGGPPLGSAEIASLRRPEMPGFSPGSFKLNSASCLDPQPDWTLDELKQELEALAESFETVALPAEKPLPVNSTCVSWRSLAAIADFGRESRTFRVSAFDSDSDVSEDSEESEGNLEHGSNYDGQEVISNDNGDAGHAPDISRSFSGALHSTLETEELLVFRKTDAVEGSLYELERERLLRVQEEVRLRHLSLEVSIREETLRSLGVFKQVERERQLKHELARRIDKQYQRSIAEVRDQHLSAVQRDHEQRSQVEERRIRKEAAAEDARRREIAAREERERQERARIEAEAKKKADTLLAKKAAEEEEKRKHSEAVAAASAVLQQTAEEKKGDKIVQEKRSSPKKQQDGCFAAHSPTQGMVAGPKATVAVGAAKFEAGQIQKLKILQEASNMLLSDPAMKKDLKSCERSIVKIWQQVSATQDQVRKKSEEIVRLLNNSHSYLPFVIVTLASKLMSQCESQVLRLPSFAFALAQVVVNVSSQVPDVMIAVVAKLHEACIFTIPKYYIFRKTQFETDRSYYKALGYNDDAGKLESTDNYVARMHAYMTLYACITQTEGPHGSNPHGLKEGWAWCARLLNNLPADRLTASALEAFLKVAGYRLHQVYPKVFLKLMQAIASHFVASLKAQNDPDSRAVVNRLETYLQTHQFMREPEGHNMPATDISSTLRA